MWLGMGPMVSIQTGLNCGLRPVPQIGSRPALARSLLIARRCSHRLLHPVPRSSVRVHRWQRRRWRKILLRLLQRRRLRGDLWSVRTRGLHGAVRGAVRPAGRGTCRRRWLRWRRLPRQAGGRPDRCILLGGYLHHSWESICSVSGRA